LKVRGATSCFATGTTSTFGPSSMHVRLPPSALACVTRRLARLSSQGLLDREHGPVGRVPLPSPTAGGAENNDTAEDQQ